MHKLDHNSNNNYSCQGKDVNYYQIGKHTFSGICIFLLLMHNKCQSYRLIISMIYVTIAILGHPSSERFRSDRVLVSQRIALNRQHLDRWDQAEGATHSCSIGVKELRIYEAEWLIILQKRTAPSRASLLGMINKKRAWYACVRDRRCKTNPSEIPTENALAAVLRTDAISALGWLPPHSGPAPQGSSS